MQPCAVELCKLRPELVNLELKDQLALVLACKIADAQAFAKCAEKQRALTDWVKRQ